MSRNIERGQLGVGWLRTWPLQLREQMAVWPAALRNENSQYLEFQPSQGPSVYHNPVAFLHATEAPPCSHCSLPDPISSTKTGGGHGLSSTGLLPSVHSPVICVIKGTSTSAGPPSGFFGISWTQVQWSSLAWSSSITVGYNKIVKSSGWDTIMSDLLSASPDSFFALLCAPESRPGLPLTCLILSASHLRLSTEENQPEIVRRREVRDGRSSLTRVDAGRLFLLFY